MKEEIQLHLGNKVHPVDLVDQVSLEALDVVDLKVKSGYPVYQDLEWKESVDHQDTLD